MRWRASSLLALVVLLTVLVASALRWTLPPQAWAWYGGWSVLAYLAYSRDKQAARQGHHRTPERTLLVLGLLGGWPGAVVAQERLRHKTQKLSFRASFWASVALNLSALLLAFTPVWPAWTPLYSG